MIIKYVIFLITFLPCSNCIQAQGKAVLLQNGWHNDLNNYNPNEFIDQLLENLRLKLGVKEFEGDTKAFTSDYKGRNLNDYARERIKTLKATTGNVYFIVLDSELRLPAFNLGKFLFRSPPRSSKLTLTLHVYDSAAVEVLGDTITNRGCLVKTIDENKGPKFFYHDYKDFMSDMRCHLEYIRKVLQEKPLLKMVSHAMTVQRRAVFNAGKSPVILLQCVNVSESY